MTKPSEYWAELEQDAAKFSTAELAQFRSGGGLNDRFAAWNPRKRGMTFFKFFLARLIADQNDDFFEAYRRLGRTDLGNPPAIMHKHRGGPLKIDFEYLMAIEEFLFVAGALKSAPKTVCEVGAGFGRTCHCFLRNFPGIATYTIVDLPNIMQFSRAYLKAVLTPDEFAKVVFVDALTIPPATKERWRFDLALSSNALQSLEEDIARDYMALFAQTAAHVYLRDAIAKYRPEDLIGEQAPPIDAKSPVLALGLCRKVIDVFDPDELAAAREEFVAAYRPSTDFDVAGSQPAAAIPFYHNVLYRRRG